MEAAGSAATILQLLSFTADVLVAGYSYLSKVKKAPREISLLLKETAELNALLCQFESILSNDTKSHVIGALETMQSLGVFEDCKMLVNVVQRLVKMCERNDGQFAMNSVKRIMWPFKEKEVKQTLEQLTRMKDTLSAAVAVDSVATLSRLEDMVKSIDAMTISTLNAVQEQLPISSTVAGSLGNIEKQLINKEEANQRVTIQNWLHPEGMDLESNLKVALKGLSPRTGQWFLKCREFQAWLGDDNAPLWLYGIAGCGKTTLLATVIQYLREDAESAGSMLLYFFCDYRDPSKQSFQDLLHTIIKQLLNANSDCFADAQARYHEATRAVNGGNTAAQRLSIADYLMLIKQMCSHWMRVNLIVDAIDECVNLSEFVDGLSELSKSNIRVLMSSRHDLSSRQAISRITPSSMSLVEHMATDIDVYLRGEIAARLAAGSLKLRDSSLAGRIFVTLKKKADRLILIAKLLLEHICSLRTDRAIKDALDGLPSGINATYDEVLYRMYNTHQKDIYILQQILRWLVGCKVPLTLDQLAEAISLRPYDKALDPDCIPNDIQDLIACCGSLVTVTTQVTTEAMYPDLRGHRIDIVALAHASVGEYLTSGEIGKSLLQHQDLRRSPESMEQMARLFNIELQSVHEELLLLSLQYIGLNDFYQHIQDPVFRRTDRTPIPIGRNRQLLTARISQHPFLIYASRYWPDHFRESNLCNSLSKRSESLLDWFLNPSLESGQYISWQQMYHHDSVFYCRGRPPLHYAIEFQLDSVVRLLLPQTNHVNSFIFGHTALHVAAKHGTLKFVTELLSRGAAIDLKSESYQRQKTALHYAAEAGHIEVVRFLLESGASVHARSFSGSTPIYAAARSGSIKAFNLLLDAGADINAQTYDGWTPLFEAVSHCRRRMACHLLRLGANPKVFTDDGDNVLMMIARSLTNGAQRLKGPSISTPADVLREIEEIQKSKVEENTLDPYLRLFRYLHYDIYIRLINTNLDTRAGTERDKYPRFGESGSRILFLFDNKE